MFHSVHAVDKEMVGADLRSIYLHPQEKVCSQVRDQEFSSVSTIRNII